MADDPINHAEADLLNADFSEADLRQADFAEKKLLEADLSEADLSGADLSEADLSEADLSEANLSEADLSKANLWATDFTEANLRDADLSGATLQAATLTDANLQFAKLFRAKLRDATLIEADLRFADLNEASLHRATLRGADLSKANIQEVNAKDADFSEADLQNSNLGEASFVGANLSGADLSGADLVGVDFLGADMKSAKLRVTDFTQFSELFSTEVGKSSETVSPLDSSQTDEHWINSKVLLLSALYKERDSLLSLLREYDTITEKSGKLDSRIFEGSNGGQFIVKAEGETGNTRIRETTVNFIEEYDPHFVILYGIAAGFEQRVGQGDILVADQIVDLRKYKIEDGYLFEPNVIDSPGSLEYPFKIESIAEMIDQPNISFQLHTDMIIGSSDTLSKDEDFMKSAKDIHRKMGALEMEGAGVAEACTKADTAFFVIKSISDYGGSDKDDSLHSACCDLAAETVVKGFLMENST